MKNVAHRTTKRSQVLYSGHVQGVGFRATVYEIARGFQVTGFVQNLSDGRVELVAEGLPKELTSFLQEIAEQRVDFIRSVQCDNRASTGEFAGFRIRY